MSRARLPANADQPIVRADVPRYDAGLARSVESSPAPYRPCVARGWRPLPGTHTSKGSLGDSGMTGRGAVWLARLLWEQEVEGSNPFAPTYESVGFNQLVLQ